MGGWIGDAKGETRQETDGILAALAAKVREIAVFSVLASRHVRMGYESGEGIQRQE
jgi:hypothetical protein